MDLTTHYLGLTLANPFVPGASPLTSDRDMALRLEDAGAPAIVMPSLFQEDIARYGEGADAYLEHLVSIKRSLGVPVIASLNGTTPDRWLRYAQLIERAGADALELNFYHVATDPRENAAEVECRLLDIVRNVKHIVSIPVAVKLSPFFSSLSHVAQELDAAGANGLVLFNRFHQPDIDPEMLDAVPRLHLSTSGELLLRVRWLAILSGRINASLAATGGVHTGFDAVKAVLAGAHGLQMVAALLKNGPKQLAVVRRELAHWLEEHEYESLRQAQGSMSLLRSPDPEAFERGNYMRALQAWRGQLNRGMLR